MLVSPYLKERCVWAGQEDVYSASNDLIAKFLCIQVNSMQVHRMTNHYGAISEKLVNSDSAKSLELTDTEVVYAQVDGGMVLTREEKWQEVKVGRVFKQSDIVKESKNRNSIRQSLYTAHLGNCETFCAEFKPLVDTFADIGDRLVFLSDGAVWIKNWNVSNYPHATHILDFFHATEYLNKWSEWIFSDKTMQTSTYETNKAILLKQGGEVLVEHLKIEQQANTTSSETRKKEQDKILNYLINNTFRMDYPTYRARGLCIGSGAIEAAHKTVVQKRMKRSGQHWSVDNVQNMLNLRTVKMSGQWDKIISLVRAKAA